MGFSGERYASHIYIAMFPNIHMIRVYELWPRALLNPE